MKLVTYSEGRNRGVGVLTANDRMTDLTNAGLTSNMIDLIERYGALRKQIGALLESDRHTRPLSEVHVEAPVPMPRRNIFCVGKNYAEHANEFGSSGFDSGDRRERDS